MCCDSWGHKESDTTERLNRTELTECNEHENPRAILSQAVYASQVAYYSPNPTSGRLTIYVQASLASSDLPCLLLTN